MEYILVGAVKGICFSKYIVVRAVVMGHPFISRFVLFSFEKPASASA